MLAAMITIGPTKGHIRSAKTSNHAFSCVAIHKIIAATANRRWM